MPCKRCGICCTALRIAIGPDDIKRLSEKYPGADVSFAKRNFINISEKEAFSLNPHLQQAIKNETGKGFFYTCRKFNKESKICMAHKERPNVCRDYPNMNNTMWYNPECGMKTR